MRPHETINTPREHHRLLMKEHVILALCLLALLLSYVASVGNSYMPGRWQVDCCGREFWWSSVGASLVLVACGVALLVKRVWAFVTAMLLSLYVFYYSLAVALQRWNDYSSIDKTYGLKLALLPVYRPLSILLSLFVMAVALRQLARISLERRT